MYQFWLVNLSFVKINPGFCVPKFSKMIADHLLNELWTKSFLRFGENLDVLRLC